MGLLVPCVSGAEPFPYRFFPLEEGNFWRYVSCVDCVPFRVGWELRVVQREGDRAVLRWQFFHNFDTGQSTRPPGYLRVVDRGNNVDVELPEEGDVSLYRFEEDEFLHRYPLDSCADGPTEVSSRNEVVDTHVGTFSPCVLLAFTRSINCADGGLIWEWWYPEVGLVKWAEKSASGVREWFLLELERNLPRFVRGDVQGDGALDIADPIALLGYLYLGSREPPCLDAADADDSGALDLSDAVYLLLWLFSGGRDPPPPTPAAAGAYPLSDCKLDGTTLDALDCALARCEEAP